MIYNITASNHGLGSVPCNLNQALFGQFAHNGNMETSREFATRAEAETALKMLESSGDWPDGRPDYEIVEAIAEPLSVEEEIEADEFYEDFYTA